MSLDVTLVPAARLNPTDPADPATASWEPMPGTGKAQVCSLCRPRTCCLSFGVPLGPNDLRRIAGLLALPPLAFCQAVPVDTDEGFLLDPRQPELRYRLELRRAGGEEEELAPQLPCLFLLELPGGFRRCSLGAAMPALCRSFPLTRDPFGGLSIYEGAGCCRLWSPADVRLPDDLALTVGAAEEMALLGARTAEWNARLLGQRQPASFGEFLDFLAGG
ncbi:MAG: hypothetical protein RBU45_12645 [Myxococcota bacterium]|nr:hypothetical protein [Myxococcota bacterium]